MSNELSGLELRKAANEVLGWTYRGTQCSGGFSCHRQDCKCDSATNECTCPFESCDHALEIDCIHGCGTDGPAVESKPEISEPMFLDFCAKHNLRWEMSTCQPHDDWKDQHIVIWMHSTVTYFEVEVEGHNPSAARARAIVAGGKR